MPMLQVKDVPDEIYFQLNYLAQKENRSLAQETLFLLRERLETKISNKERRKEVFEKMHELKINGKNIPDPVKLVREDRER